MRVASHALDNSAKAFFGPSSHTLSLFKAKNGSGNKGKGDFHLDGMGRIARRKSGRVAPFIYSGIQLVSHRLMRDAPQGSFSTNLFWNRAIEEGRLYGISHTGVWFEVGEPAAIPATEEWLARV